MPSYRYGNTMSSQTKAVAQLNERLEFVNLTPADKRSLAALAPTINASLDGALNTFYAKAQKQPETAMFFKDGAHVAHAKARQARHWETIASAQFDADYVSAVSAVGRVHARLGLEPRWYIGGYALMLEGIIRAVVAGELKGLLVKGKARKLASDVSVIVKAAMIDMDYAISVYLEALAEQRTQVEIERAAIRAEQDAAMSALGEALARLSAGDLTASLDAPLADAFAKLQGDFNKAVASLGETISLVSQSVENVSSQSHEIAESTDEMAKRTEQQATALEETAAALEQIGALSKQAKVRTTEIHDIIVKSAEEASKSEEVVEQAINAMSDIEASSQRMTQIIGTIDEIAFQTNLLALNAGVEAARAGDKGKGFAVVAQE
ncbi:MAG: globin-coupled sensor protein, partial [Alphaproteobacteria bacterium]